MVFKCPAADCDLEAPLRRVLDHFRQSHSPDDCTEDFIAAHNLVQCHFCSHWFTRLGQHTSRCKKNSERASQPNSRTSGSAPSSSASCDSSVFAAPVFPDGSALSHEDSAWDLIRNTSVDKILSSAPPQTVRKVAASIRGMFADCCSIPLRKIAENPYDETAWKLFLLIPRMILQPSKRGGRSQAKNIRTRYEKFLQYNWNELLQFHSVSQNKCSISEDTMRKNAALRLVQCGELSKAARILTSSGLAAPTDETRDKLAAKHPRRMDSYNNYQRPCGENLHLGESFLLDQVRSSPKGSAYGPSGWRYEHLRALVAIVSSHNLLCDACNAIAFGHLPDSISHLLSSARLIALPKPNGDVRPIAIGEVLRRLTARSLCCQFKGKFEDHFAPLQHGVATEGGSELVINHVTLALESHPNWNLVKLDMKNAFNTINRTHCLKEVQASFPSLLPHVFQMYERENYLVYQMDNQPVIIKSLEGVHQGDPLGPAIFSLGIQPILNQAQQDHSSCHILAYLDDIFILGDLEVCLSAAQTLKQSLSQIGLLVNDHKCEIFAPNSPEVDSLPFPLSTSGTIVLGTPIGSDTFITSVCESIAQSGEALCQELSKLDEPQSSLLLLRHCHVPRLNHLARSVGSSLLFAAACHQDSLTQSAFCNIFGLSSMDSMKWQQASLPIKCGGFGLTSIVEISAAAFIAGWSFASSHLISRFPYLSEYISDVTSQALPNSALHRHICEASQSLFFNAKSMQLQEWMKQPTKLQHKLSALLHERKARAILESAPSSRDAARLRSVCGKGAGSWLEAIPSEKGLALSPSEFRLAASLRLGFNLPFSSWGLTCQCGKEVDEFHLLTCKLGGGPVWAHNEVVAGWSSCLQDLKIHHQKEPRFRYRGNEDRPDIVVFDTGFGTGLDLDIALTHPWRNDHILRTANENGFAAAQMEVIKRKKYSNELVQGTSTSPLFKPLVFEHFGRWGADAEAYLNTLAKRSRDQHGKCNEAEFRGYWRRRLSVLLQRCNGRVIEKKLEKILGFACDPSSSDRSVQYTLH